ncbi:MAG: response regulator transcription factor [Steroidobacteraceae bacterium]
MEHSRKPRIIIIEQPGLLRDGLQQLLDADDQFEPVDVFDSADHAINNVSERGVELAIITLTNDAGGIETIRQLRTAYPQLPLLALTFLRDYTVVDAALRSGADGYVLKDDPHDELRLAMRSLLDGRQYLSPGICRDIIRILMRSPMARTRAEDDSLSRREREVLQLVASGLRTREIADLLALSPKTIEKHRGSLMRKLGLRSAAAVTAYAIANGYCNP